MCAMHRSFSAKNSAIATLEIQRQILMEDFENIRGQIAEYLL